MKFVKEFLRVSSHRLMMYFYIEFPLSFLPDIHTTIILGALSKICKIYVLYMDRRVKDYATGTATCKWPANKKNQSCR